MTIAVLDGPLKFPLGFVVCTRGVMEEVDGQDVHRALCRHARGDWGLVCEDDRLENEMSLEHGYRLMSVYEDFKGKRFWVITEADRSATTFLLPEEY
ncbi:MAG: hypothetical protein SGI77_04410 [Pirellulaceae bacterium]|nr:hypothetical protein [Pirellulaceae bacterium]